MRIEMTVFGQAVPKARPKAFRRGNFVGVYTPSKTKKWESIIREEAIKHKPGGLSEIALIMDVRFHLLRPRSLPKKVKQHIKRPDVDNLVKSVFDALHGIIFRDDSQVVSLMVGKIYTTDNPRVEIVIEEI